MKPLDQYPTPETDKNDFTAVTIAVNHPPSDHRFCHAAHARDLERRLAACREFASEVHKTSSNTRLVRLAFEALALTAPKQ